MVLSLNRPGRCRDSAGRYGTFFKITCLRSQTRKSRHRSSGTLSISNPSVHMDESWESLNQQQTIHLALTMGAKGTKWLVILACAQIFFFVTATFQLNIVHGLCFFCIFLGLPSCRLSTSMFDYPQESLYFNTTCMHAYIHAKIFKYLFI